jgi:hypothetical protein
MTTHRMETAFDEIKDQTGKCRACGVKIWKYWRKVGNKKYDLLRQEMDKCAKCFFK